MLRSFSAKEGVDRLTFKSYNSMKEACRGSWRLVDDMEEISCDVMMTCCKPI